MADVATVTNVISDTLTTSNRKLIMPVQAEATPREGAEVVVRARARVGEKEKVMPARRQPHHAGTGTSMANAIEPTARFLIMEKGAQINEFIKAEGNR